MDKLGHYTILEKIGEGGMGQVFRARDERLRREVAIKVLPEAFVKDPERLARFEREAQVLAQLHHPNVASIFGLEQDGENRFLSLELVPGKDLAQTMAATGGPVGVDDAVEIAAQIAAAVEAAHEMGIVHRDLKPSNVMITPDGVAKVLDFGLAKAGEIEAGDSSLNLSNSPTLTGLMTNENVILGTAAYMSPEQARGKKVDKRSDIWSFGVLFFEMLSGKQLFHGETVSDTLAGVLKTDIDFGLLPDTTPHHVRMLLERCLSRDPKMRLRDIGEARIVLAAGEDVGLPQGDAAAAPSGGVRPWMVGAAAVLALAGGVALGSVLLKPAVPEAPQGLSRKLIIDAGPGNALPSEPVLSPDGTRIAYLRDGSIWVRDLDKLEPRHLERTRDAMDLFWSPDGDRIGYLTGSQVMTVDPSDGNPVIVAPTGYGVSDESGAGGTWSPEHGILFARGEQDIHRVSDRGGVPAVFVAADTSTEGDLHEPALTPDGSILVVPHRRTGSNGIDLIADDGRFVVLPPGDTRIFYPTWSPTGHVLYERRGDNPGVWGLRYDLAARKALGEPFLLFANGANPSAARDGSVVVLRGAQDRFSQLVESDAEGNVLRRIGGEHMYDHYLALSPDQNRLAVIRQDDAAEQIWLLDLARGTESRLTFVTAPNKSDPHWSPDGRWLTYGLGGGSQANLVIQATDGSTTADSLYGSAVSGSFVPGTEDLLLSTYRGATEWDVVRGSRVPNGETSVLCDELDWQYAPQVSPDLKYFVYVSRETGTDQIFLKRYPDGSGKWQVSADGGLWPRWTADGKRILFCQGDTILEVDFESGDSPVLGVPRPLFTRSPLGRALPFGWVPNFTANADGTRFYYFVSSNTDERTPTSMVLLENWVTEFSDGDDR